MDEIELSSTSGKRFFVKVRSNQSDQLRRYVFAYAKSGSTLLDRLVRDYCKAVNIPTFSLFGEAFTNGVKPMEISSNAACCFEYTGVVFTGFRHYPVHFDVNFKNAKSVLLVRDPRDMLVSLYFSIAKSHVVLKGDEKFSNERINANSTSIDDFVISRAESYLSNFNRYKESLNGKELLTFKYEDVIYNKAAWLTQLLEYFDFRVNKTVLDEVVKKHDLMPREENEQAHVRQVHPGNYLKKLKQDTILQLNQKLKVFLDAYDYKS